MFNPLIPVSDQDRISPYNIKTISNRQMMRIKKIINYGMYLLIQYQILQTSIMRIIWEKVRRTSREILGVKGLIGGLRARTIPWFFGHFWKCSEVVEFWHVDTFKNGQKIKGLFLLWALQFSMIFIMGVFNFSDWTVFPGNDLHFICFCCWCKLFFFLHRLVCLIFNETPS